MNLTILCPSPAVDFVFKQLSPYVFSKHTEIQVRGKQVSAIVFKDPPYVVNLAKQLAENFRKYNLPFDIYYNISGTNKRKWMQNRRNADTFEFYEGNQKSVHGFDELQVRYVYKLLLDEIVRA